MRRLRTVVALGALATALLLPAGSRADEESYGTRFLAKAGHGVGNVVLGWYEIPKNAVNITSDKNILWGATFGIVRGAVHAVGRTVIGVAQFLTSPIPTDQEYVTPAFVGDRLSEDTRYWTVHLPGEWTHFGPLDDGGFGRR